MSCVLSSFNSFMSSNFRLYLLALLFFYFVEPLWDTKNVKSITEASNKKHKTTPKRVTAPKSYGKMSKGRQKESKRKGPKSYSVQVLEKEKHGGVKVIPCQDRYIDICMLPMAVP